MSGSVSFAADNLCALSLAISGRITDIDAVGGHDSHVDGTCGGGTLDYVSMGAIAHGHTPNGAGNITAAVTVFEGISTDGQFVVECYGCRKGRFSGQASIKNGKIQRTGQRSQRTVLIGQWFIFV